MKQMRSQAGKGMSGFFMGMIMATAMIAGVLFFLNTNKTTFQEHPVKQRPTEPEIMRPEGSQQVAPPPVAIRPEDSTEGRSPSEEVKPPKPAPVADNTDKAEEPKTEERKQADSKPKEPKPDTTAANKGKTDPAADKTDQAVKPAETPKTTATPKPAETPKSTAKPAKPGPEQILESGSLEKAEQANRDKAAKDKQEAQRAQAAKEKAAKAEAAKDKTAKAEAGKDKSAKAEAGKDKTAAAAKPANSAKARLQVGSFKNSAAADAQRAKLAMLGVNTNVVKGTGADGQTVYRVQTGSMSRQQAEQTAQRLKQNQIDSLVRSAQ